MNRAIAIACLLAAATAGARKPIARCAASGRAMAAEELLAAREKLVGQRITVEGFLVGHMTGCGDIACKNGAPCCHNCGGVANLSATATEPERAREVTLTRAGDPTFGHCHDTGTTCEMICDPPTKTRLRITGRLRATPPYFWIEVESLCRVE